MPDKSPEPTATPEGLPPEKELFDVLKRAQDGDESALPALRRALDAGLNVLKAGSIAGEAREALLAPLAGKSLLVREQMGRQIDALAAELAGPHPAPIERLLSERAAFCWHVVHQYERAYASSRELSIKQADYQQRRIDAAHRRYLSALKSLATVRRLALPAVQINLARRQVNVSGGSALPCPNHPGSGGGAP